MVGIMESEVLTDTSSKAEAISSLAYRTGPSTIQGSLLHESWEGRGGHRYHLALPAQQSHPPAVSGYPVASVRGRLSRSAVRYSGPRVAAAEPG